MTRHTYEIRVVGSLGPVAREAFADMLVEVEPTITVLSGDLDQRGLHDLRYVPVAGRDEACRVDGRCRPVQLVTLASRTTQRKPRWQVDVSMGWAIRAAGR